MGETKQLESIPKQNRFKSLKSEFKKIVWPDKDSLVKQTIAVIVVSVVLGIIIATVDLGYTEAVKLLFGQG